MPKKLFIDSDIILDLLCGRQGFYDFAAEIFELAELGKVKLYTSTLVLANVFYMLRKKLGTLNTKTILRKFRVLTKLLSVNSKIIDLALGSGFRDFEDAIQYYTARENHIPVLITRNIKDYKVKDIIVQTAEKYLQN